MNEIDKTNIKSIASWLGTGSIDIFGVPFSGKDTHGTELAKIFGAELISGGDILRSSGGPAHLKKHMATGNLAPTDEFLATVLPYLSKPEFAKKPLILSSLGRWHGEEASVMKAAQESSHPIKAVIYLSISESESEKRWHLAERGREDDAAHHILLNRFNEFRTKTLPVIDFYRQHGLLIEVNAMPAQEIVTADILSRLANLSRSK